MGFAATRFASAPSPIFSAWPPAKGAGLRKLLKNQPLVSPDQAFSIVGSRPHGHIELVLGAFRRLALPALLDGSASPQRARPCSP